jgi:hypothetical protein
MTHPLTRYSPLIGVILLIIAAIFFSLWTTNVAQQQDLPNKKQIDVPFSAQAPEGNWAEPWQNACEETSVIMIDSFYKGNTLSKAQAKQEILRVFSLKEDKFEASKDESMEKIADLINSTNLNWKAHVKVDPTLADMKNELANDQPIIVPVYAPKLKSNPQYGFGDINYHVFIISGYDDLWQQFIVKDPGSSRGNNQRYSYEEVMNAIHDFLPSDYDQGRKAVIFTSKR